MERHQTASSRGVIRPGFLYRKVTVIGGGEWVARSQGWMLCSDSSIGDGGSSEMGEKRMGLRNKQV